MLNSAKITAFLATADAKLSKAFYEQVVGLHLVAEDEFAMEFDSNGIALRIQKVEAVQPHPYTSLGWRVGDLRDAVATLVERGVRFERYPFLEQDGAGIWLAPSGTQVAWFKDPDGSLLSLSEGPKT